MTREHNSTSKQKSKIIEISLLDLKIGIYKYSGRSFGKYLSNI